VQIKIRYNPHANLAKPWHALILDDWRESIACTLPQFCAADADAAGAQLFDILKEQSNVLQRENSPSI
jgi:hypothetical protein